MIGDILQALKAFPNSITNGSLDIPSNPTLAVALTKLPWDEGFLHINLDAINGFTADQLDILKVFQCDWIRRLRAEAYRNEADGLFLGVEADGDDRAEWLSKRATIKERYPWPGAYR